MRQDSDIAALMCADPVRWRLLGLVADLALPDAWIAAGFVRNAVWDALHGRAPSHPDSDVDVIWFDAGRLDPELDRTIEAALHAEEPAIRWSVKNQARMHLRNGDAPYTSATDAMRHWPETVTATAVRRAGDNLCEVVAHFNLDDLFALVVRPGPRFIHERRHIFESRIREKRWFERWPKLTLADG